MSQGVAGGGGIDPGENAVKNPVLTFMHCWSLGNNAREIAKIANTSFTEPQLEEASQ